MLHAQLAKAYQRLAQLQIVEHSHVFTRDQVEHALKRAKNAIHDSNLVKTNLDYIEVAEANNFAHLLDVFETLVIMRDKLSVFED